MVYANKENIIYVHGICKYKLEYYIWYVLQTNALDSLG